MKGYCIIKWKCISAAHAAALGFPQLGLLPKQPPPIAVLLREPSKANPLSPPVPSSPLDTNFEIQV